MFGQSKPLFGAAAPTASVFGTPSTSAFGAPAAPAFGAPQQAPTLFGSPQVNTFGSPATGSTGLFGQQQPQQQQSLFGGTPAPAAGGFGSAFGKPAAPSIFGAPAAAAQPTGLFGSPAQGFGSQAPAFGVQATPVGTTVKFNPPAGTDTMMKNGVSQSISTRHQCITAMKEYETKSLDELRMEDYSAGRKTGAPAQFGTPAQPSGMFGSTSTATPAFGASTGTGLFGQNKPVFGASTTTATSTGLFGGTSAFNKPFGAPTTAFGTAQPVMQPTGGLFGNTSTAPAFGAQTQTPSLFGQNTAAAKPFSFATPSPATTQTSLFGNTGFNAQPANQPKPLFGTTPAPAFGTVTSTAFPAFGNTTTTTSSLFGATSQPSLFSNPTSKPFTGFGTQAPAFGTASTPSLIGGTQQTSLFGNTGASNAFGTQQPSLFGSTTAGTGLFGTSNFAPAAQPLSGFSTSFTGFGQPAQQTTMNAAVNNTSSNINEMLLARLQTLPYGNSTLFENDLLSSVSISSSLKLPSDVKSLNQFSMGSKQATVKRVPSTRSNSLLFDGMEEEDPKEKLAAIDIFKPRRNFKKLELKPKQVEETTPKELSKMIASPSLEIREAPRILATGRSPEADNTILEFARRPRQAETSVSTPLTTKGRSREFSVSPASFQDLGDESSLNLPSNTSLHLKCGLRSSRPDYYTIPPLETIDSYLDPETGDCFVDGFTIGRRGYGSIFWEGKINVRDLNLDEIVHIRRKEVIVYPDDENKSPEGKGLNRPAQVTLDQVWPVDKSTREIIKDVPRLERMRYAEKVEAATAKLKATFKDYRPETGSWVFCVKHFSKYGLLDDEDEEDVVDRQAPAARGQVVQQVVKKPAPVTFTDVKMQTQVDFTIPVDRENELQNKKMAQFAPYSPATTYTVFDPMDYSQSYFPSSGTEPLEGLEALADMKKQYNPFDEMRNLFFAEDEEEDREEASLNRSLFKKSRHLYSRPSATDLQFISENRPAAAIDIPTVSRKREMTFKTNAAISENKAIIDISSIKCAPCPRVGFSRGSACLITYSGSKVNIMAVKLIPDVSKEEGRLQEQMDKLTDVITHSSVQPVAQVRPKISNSRNIQSHENLVVALYGDKLQSTDYGKEEERINATIDWLCERNKLYKLPVNCLDRIIYHLSVNDVKMAVDEALKGRQPRLATLIACGTCNTTKDALVLQLDSWKQSKADEHIDQSLLRLYLLLSGGVHWRLSSGSEIFAVEGLEWSQQLALLLLYGTHDGLSDCVKHVRTNTNDVEYHLISGDSHWVTLSACANELEAWFLHQSLVGYGALSTSDALSDVVHGNLVAQMMSESPKWSSFIACHITDDELRDFAVKEILNHGVMHLSDNDLIWIEKNLLIDKKIISSATSLFKKSQVSPLSKPLGLSSFDLTALGLDVVLAAS